MTIDLLIARFFVKRKVVEIRRLIPVCSQMKFISKLRSYLQLNSFGTNDADFSLLLDESVYSKVPTAIAAPVCGKLELRAFHLHAISQPVDTNHKPIAHNVSKLRNRDHRFWILNFLFSGIWNPPSIFSAAVRQ